MRMITTAVAVVAAAGALFGAAFLAYGKGPDAFRAEVSGGGLTEPVVIEGPLTMETVFFNDAFEVPPPASREPAYTIRLTPAEPTPEDEDFKLILTYFPGDGDGPALLSGDWDNHRYFQASPEFQAILGDAIGSRSSSLKSNGDDGVSAVWYIAPSLAAVGLMLIGGLPDVDCSSGMMSD